MSKLNHSKSDDNLLLNPISKLAHSKPTAHGTGARNFGARDDSSSNDYIVSSPYENASSAIAVLDILPLAFGAIRGYVPDRQHISTASIPDQQPTVGRTKDLSLPVDFLPGEDDIKLREDITYRGYYQPTTYRGEIILTKYRLLFITKPPNPVQVLVDVPIGMIGEMAKIGRQKLSRSDGTSYGIKIICKNFQQFFFGNDKEQHQRRNLFDHLTRLIFPFSISSADKTNPQKFFSTFFAWNYKKEICPDLTDEGWRLYDKVEDYTRMGIQETHDPYWTIDTEINKNYALCDTYPDILVLPSNFDPARLPNVASFRSRNRIPTLSWFSRETYVTITRASQPLTGLNRRCQDDNDFLHEISETNGGNQTSKFFILDARPKVNAVLNRPNGGGYENYPDCELEFQNIDNIHVMRESLHKLYSSIRHGYFEEKTSNDLENSNWLTHIRAILTSTNRLVSLLYQEKRSVLVHCSDGWDRTSQLTSLTMLMLDPYYRTLYGYMILIEKEWISFGHKFFLRVGHGDKQHSERSPVFLQFLDCTYQLLQQFESAFEFNERLLLTIADSLYSCQYGTFLLNSEKDRVDMKISRYTISAWTPILRDRQTYLNPSYNDRFGQISQINVSVNQIRLWKNYYCRYVPDHQSTLEDSVPRRDSTVVNLRNRFTADFSHLQIDDPLSHDQSRLSSSFTLSGTQTKL